MTAAEGSDDVPMRLIGEAYHQPNVGCAGASSEKSRYVIKQTIQCLQYAACGSTHWSREQLTLERRAARLDAALVAAEGGALPLPPGHKLEGARGDLLAGPRHPDHHGLPPPPAPRRTLGSRYRRISD